MKLSNRLALIASLVDNQYTSQIWDMCCDHGKLAFYLKEKYFMEVQEAEVNLTLC